MFLCLGQPENPALGTGEQGEATFGPSPPALINLSELNTATKWRIEPFHQAPPPAPSRHISIGQRIHLRTRAAGPSPQKTTQTPSMH